MAVKTKRQRATNKQDFAAQMRDLAQRHTTGTKNEVDLLTAPLGWWRDRWADREIRRAFIENFIYIRDKFDGQKLKLLKFNRVQRTLHARRGRKSVVLKARKQGVSRYFLACEFADAVVLSGQRIRIVPHDPDTEEEFWGDLQTMWEMLPKHLQPFARNYSKELMQFHDPRKGTVDSRLKTSTVQPGSEDKGRGQAITRLHVTEMPFWNGDQSRAAKALFEAAAEGEISVESTADGMESFEALYQKAKKNEGGWRAFFFEWWYQDAYRVPDAMLWQVDGQTLLTGPHEELEPGRADKQRLTEKEVAVAQRIHAFLIEQGDVPAGSDWRCDEVAERLCWRRQKIEELEGGEADFAVEYPEDDVQCFTQSGRPVVASEYLKIGCKPSSEPQSGHEYFVIVDGAGGKERGDASSIQVLDVWLGEQVHAEWLKRKPDAVAARACELSDLYNGALLIIERNGLGLAVIQAVVEAGYDQLLYSHPTTAQLRQLKKGERSWDEIQAEADPGFYTDKWNKPLMGRLLEQGLRTGELVLSSQQWIDEARHVVWQDNGGFAASSGYHDDGFMALAIGWLVRVIYYGQFGGFVGVEPEAGEFLV